MADPPWQYDNKKTGGSLKSGSSQKYSTMQLMELIDLNIYLDSLMDKDSMCFIWTTNSFMRQALTLLDHWGFQFKTLLTWEKRSYGLGYWFRNKTEHVLFGTRGKVPSLTRLGVNLPNIFKSDKVLKHSEKPEEFYKYIVTVATKYTIHKGYATNILELFARKNRDYYCYMNWTCLGQEITGNDIRKDLKALAS